MGKYTEAYNEFKETYDLDLDIKAEYNGAKSLASIDALYWKFRPR